MKQFEYVNCGVTYGPYSAKEVSERFPLSVRGVSDLQPGETYTDCDGDVWSIVPDLVLQDDVPLTSEDVTACRESAVRVRYTLRLERIATAALQGLIASGLPINEAPAAQRTIVYAKALIAELDKQS